MNECGWVMESNKFSFVGKVEVDKCIIKGYKLG